MIESLATHIVDRGVVSRAPSYARRGIVWNVVEGGLVSLFAVGFTLMAIIAYINGIPSGGFVIFSLMSLLAAGSDCSTAYFFSWMLDSEMAHGW